MTDFRDALVSYLESEKEYCESDIRASKALSDNEKEDAGLIIRDAHIVHHNDAEYEFSISINNTKLRPGDKVLLKSTKSGKAINAKVIESGFYNISLTCLKELSIEEEYRIEISDEVLLDPMISLLRRIEEGTPGSSFLKLMAGLEPKPKRVGLGAIKPDELNGIIPEQFNAEQAEACRNAIQRPTVYCIQGPPGTGKTDVLSRIAQAFAFKGKSVLVISNTHQAVNNALNKISKNCSRTTIVKIGEELKAEGLSGTIIRAKSYAEYADNKKGNKAAPKFEVVGMTLYAAVLNLGLRHTNFNPSVILVDEAGQMPLVQAACIGAFGCGSVIFIGDDKQMPPIYHSKLENDPLSTSVFSHLTRLYPDFKTRLRVTYRMNEQITGIVSRNFYEKDGDALVASDFSKDRTLELPANSGNKGIDSILRTSSSVIQWNPSTIEDNKDFNVEEAMFISNLVNEALIQGMNISDIAVITPFRRQVRTIRECMRSVLGEDVCLPLIDTVERLQGQDVDLIIISLCATDPKYIKTNKDFIFDPNRLNVMISRAKKKVVFIGTDNLLNCACNGFESDTSRHVIR